jgi:hypothetical protein
VTTGLSAYADDDTEHNLLSWEPVVCVIIIFGLWPARKEPIMTITVAHIPPLVALIAGILILIFPRILNFVVAIYLIIIGLIGLNNIHHFIR